ncbi:MAG TPA: YqgE/AlgH family protein [Terriglobales bacterium]|nr:YqgE/AlgH family protein [Terriglobales bacterium]
MAQSHNPKDLAVGRLLVARAQVPDGRFRHAVVLLLGRSTHGTAGLVLNHPGDTPVSRLFPNMASAQGRSEAAYAGGPVETSRILVLLHLAGPLHEAQPVLPGVYVSTSLDLIRLALNAQQPAASFRVFQGYAGWTPGQLARELAAGYWTILPGSARTIFDPDPATLWTRLSRQPGSHAAAPAPSAAGRRRPLREPKPAPRRVAARPEPG